MICSIVARHYKLLSTTKYNKDLLYLINTEST